MTAQHRSGQGQPFGRDQRRSAGTAIARLRQWISLPFVMAMVLCMVSACKPRKTAPPLPEPAPAPTETETPAQPEPAPEPDPVEAEPVEEEETPPEPPSIDEQIYFEADYGPRPDLDSMPAAEQKKAATQYSGDVTNTLAKRLAIAEDNDIELDATRLPEPERAALAYVDQVHDHIHRKHKLVVTATSINVRRYPGRFGTKPLRELQMGDVVYFCGGHRAPTRPDPVEVVWYWIDDDGECDRSQPKEWIASKEAEGGKEHWLIRWHDYPQVFDKEKRRKARKAGRKADFERFNGRQRQSPAPDGVLELNPGFDLSALFRALKKCLFGVGAATLAGPVIRRAVVKATGGASRAAVAKYLGGAAVGTASTYNPRKPIAKQYGPILAGGLVASLFPNRFVGFGVGVLTCTALKLIVVNERTLDEAGDRLATTEVGRLTPSPA